MGDYYIIAAGGTGAMCAQSFIYLAAAGCADNSAKYHLLLVDKDKESDAMTACKDCLSNYNVMREQQLEKPGVYTFPEILLDTWNFTDEILAQYHQTTGNPATNLSTLTLEKLLNPNADPAMDQLLSTMYTREERDTDLNHGFYGHPNIGAPVFDYVQDRFLASTVVDVNRKQVDHLFMTSLKNTLKNGKAYVYLFGSLFGGTGATVIPNVVRALRSSGMPHGDSRLVLGGCMLMPYFRLPSCPDDSVEALAKVKPMDHKFAGQTREALEYYHQSQLLNEMMNLLLVGNSALDVTSELFARGGSQKQHFHATLLVAATAANRFFDNKLGTMDKAVGAATVKPLGELLVWKANPNGGGAYNTLTPAELDLSAEHTKLTAFLRFCIIVRYFMGLKFSTKTAGALKKDNEVRGTLRKMGLDPKDVTDEEITDKYIIPVKNADDICRGFIQYYYDIGLSGYDWSKYRADKKTPGKTVDGTQYYRYEKTDKLDPGALTGFPARWTDFANIDDLTDMLGESLAGVVYGMTLNKLMSYKMLDVGRAAVVETRFPDSMGNVYNRTLKELGLVSNLWGAVKRDDVYFCEIYDLLRQKCQ